MESAQRLLVLATLRYDNGDADNVRFVMEQDRQTAEFRVCGQED